MPILSNVEIYHPKLDPSRPNRKFDKLNPTWEIQLRTTAMAKKKEWEALGLNVHGVIPEDGSTPYFRVNLKKKSIKANGEPAVPIEVINGKREPIDPNTIGNGSIANIRILQREYQKPTGESAVASILVGVQLVKHLLYTPPPFKDDFDEIETEVVEEVVDGVPFEDNVPF